MIGPRADEDARLIAVLRRHASFFDGDAPVVVARAPGRLDLMGGIADYSGALVLQRPLAVAAWAAAQLTPDPVVRVRTTNPSAVHGATDVEMPIASLTGSYADVRAAFGRPASRWAAYIAGSLTVLHRERGIRPARGVRWLMASDVPAGKGVSSSAAIEVAALHALSGALRLSIEPRELALFCQLVENFVVGAPCGVMDQMTAACGEADALLALLCQPAELQPPVRLPDEIEIFGIDSGIRHAVTGADYESVRVGAFMGYRIIAHLAGLAVRPRNGHVEIADPIWGGYLANVGPAEWVARFETAVPERLRGADFLGRYGGCTDPVTRVDPARLYAVRQPAAHPIHEHDRVRRFRDLLHAAPLDEAHLTALGALMYESHESYSACGLGSDGTDALVALARQAGPARGVFGAKITGGGSGGTVAVLARRGSRAAVESIAADYTRSTGRAAAILSGSSDGAVRFGRFEWRSGRDALEPISNLPAS